MGSTAGVIGARVAVVEGNSVAVVAVAVDVANFVAFEFKFNGTSEASRGLPIGAPALPCFKAAMSSKLG